MEPETVHIPLAGPSRLTSSESTRHHPYPPTAPHPPIPHFRGGGRARPRRVHELNNHSSEMTPGDSTPTSSMSTPQNRHPRQRRGVDPNSGKVGRKRVTRAQARRGSSSPTTDLEAIALEDAAVKGEIYRLGLGLRDVQGDGNCLFRAVADQLWGVSGRHVEVRKLVCDYLETNREGMEAFVWPFLKEGEDYDGYVERMRQLTQFGSHIEIQAAARVFRRNIRVVMSTTSFTIPWQTELEAESHDSPTPLPDTAEMDYFTPRRRTRSSTTNLLSTPALPPPASPSYAKTLAEYIPPVRPGRSMLWLALFSQAEHFQSIRRKGDVDSGPAEVEDKLAVPHDKDMSEAARRERGETIQGDDTTQAPSGKISQVLASLPPGHGVSEKRAGGILARVKGDLGEAVEILIEELQLESEAEPEDQAGEIGREASSASTASAASPAEQVSSNPTTPSDGDAKVDKGQPLAPAQITPRRSEAIANGAGSRGRGRRVNTNGRVAMTVV